MPRSLDEATSDYETVRAEPVQTIDTMLRWERIKLREAAQSAVRLLEAKLQPTREYLDYMWTTDADMKELRVRMTTLRERIADMETIKSDALLQIK